MTKKEISLNLPSSLSFLTGRQFANNVFNDQIKNIITNDTQIEELIIIYPDRITGISISFTKQLLSNINEYQNISSITFKAGTKYLENKIKEDIIF